MDEPTANPPAVNTSKPLDQEPFDISAKEFFEISRRLEKYHALFYRLWELGKPFFSNKLPTAAVQFDKTGHHTHWIWNPEFWKTLDEYSRDFVFCHEMLHVALNHGVRIKDSKYPSRANVALDLVVNHLLVNKFGFKRERVMNADKYCWIDTVFKHMANQVEKDKHFEYYYNKLMQLIPPVTLMKSKLSKSETGDGSGQGKVCDNEGLPETVDEHDGLIGREWEEVVKELDRSLSNEEKEEIRDIVEKHFQVADNKPNSTNSQSKQAGTSMGDMWVFVDVSKVKPKRKWETIIKKWVQKVVRENDRTVEQWARVNRRFTLLPQDLMIPSEMEQDAMGDDEQKIRVLFMLDTSGSCIGLKDRFIKAANSLPRDRFDVVGACFDTSVYPVNIYKGEIRGGGGTYFHILEDFIQQAMKKDWFDVARDAKNQPILDGQGQPRKQLVWKKGEYPSAVFIITDGYGDAVNPQHPDRWYFFLSVDYRQYVPKESHTFLLKDFE